MSENYKVRSKKLTDKYKAYRVAIGDGLDDVLNSEAPLMEWKFWKLLTNKFPYDKIAISHDMIVPKRKFGSLKDASGDEIAELEDIKIELADNYDCFLETSYSRARSIKTHYHLHCIAIRDDLAE